MENINLIRKIAWSFHRSTQVDYKELFAEAALAYCECISSKNKHGYNAEKGTFATWVRSAIEHRLINFVKLEKRVPLPFSKCETETLTYGAVCYQPTPFSELFETFTEDCKKVACIMLKLEESKFEKDLILWKTKKTLIEEEGWSVHRAQKGISTLKMKICSL